MCLWFNCNAELATLKKFGDNAQERPRCIISYFNCQNDFLEKIVKHAKPTFRVRSVMENMAMENDTGIISFGNFVDISQSSKEPSHWFFNQ